MEMVGGGFLPLIQCLVIQHHVPHGFILLWIGGGLVSTMSCHGFIHKCHSFILYCCEGMGWLVSYLAVQQWRLERGIVRG